MYYYHMTTKGMS